MTTLPTQNIKAAITSQTVACPDSALTKLSFRANPQPKFENRSIRDL